MLNSQLDITALVRSKDKADKLEQLGVKTVVGPLDDAALMEAEGTKADVVIQEVCASPPLDFRATLTRRRLSLVTLAASAHY